MTDERLAQIRSTDLDPVVAWNILEARQNRRELLDEVDRLREALRRVRDAETPPTAPSPSRLGRALARLPEPLRWTLHNAIAHPLSEVLFLAGFEEASNRVHDGTIPPHAPGTGRG
jgi:hypothetical protein